MYEDNFILHRCSCYQRSYSSHPDRLPSIPRSSKISTKAEVAAGWLFGALSRPEVSPVAVSRRGAAQNLDSRHEIGGLVACSGMHMSCESLLEQGRMPSCLAYNCKSSTKKNFIRLVLPVDPSELSISGVDRPTTDAGRYLFSSSPTLEHVGTVGIGCSSSLCTFRTSFVEVKVKTRYKCAVHPSRLSTSSPSYLALCVHTS
jgi:hypothetical protein